MATRNGVYVPSIKAQTKLKTFTACALSQIGRGAGYFGDVNRQVERNLV